MTILESLREKVSDIDFGLYPDLRDLFEQYDLALENALLKLKNRAVQIKDLTHRIKELENLPLVRDTKYREDKRQGKININAF